ncbi:MAG: MoxR family ATPase [Candidatus Margulisiibacteriota bacterium]|jgi:MoxR-like ATPase
MEQSIQEITEKIKGESAFIADIYKELDKVVIGQRAVVEKILISIFCNGHVLLEGVPGLAKTLIISTLSKIIDCSFKRIQFTPDLLPADIIGTMIYNPKTMEFTQKKGPVFHNIILGDEINRAPAKVQSALLEAMQERQVTISDQTYPLPLPFIVLATQNPIEQEGTYPLPEAQVDRFFMKIKIDYPSLKEEKVIMDSQARIAEAQIGKVITASAIARVQKVIDSIYVDEKAKDYILQIVSATRNPEKHNLDLKNLIAFGASPRASICLYQAAKAHAFMQHKGFVSPEDIKSIVMDVLRHRVAISYQAEADGLTAEDIIQKILDELVVP